PKLRVSSGTLSGASGFTSTKRSGGAGSTTGALSSGAAKVSEFISIRKLRLPATAAGSWLNTARCGASHHNARCASTVQATPIQTPRKSPARSPSGDIRPRDHPAPPTDDGDGRGERVER